MLKIEAFSPREREMLVTLSGRVERKHLPELEHLIGQSAGEDARITFDFRKVGLVDREAVDFFVNGPGTRATLRGCPLYLRTWLRLAGRPTD